MNTILEDINKKKNGIKDYYELLLIVKALIELSCKDSVVRDFINNEINIEILERCISQMKNKYKLFEYCNLSLKFFNDEDLNYILNLSKQNNFPTVNEILSYMYKDYMTSNEIGQLSIKLLGNDIKDIYFPYNTNFSIVDFTNVKIYSEGVNPYFVFISELIKIIDKKDIEFNLTDVLNTPTYLDDNDNLKKFKYTISFPPMNLISKNIEINDKYNRFNFPIKKNLDVAFLEHTLATTTDKAIIVLPIGFTFRGLIEKDCRKDLILKNYIETVFFIPNNIHYGTSIETVLIVINKNKQDELIQFVDLRKDEFVEKISRNYRLSNIDKIVGLYTNKQDIPNLSKLVSKEEIESNDYSFAIDRYINENDTTNVDRLLNKYSLININEIAEIKKSQQIKTENEGINIYEILQTDFAESGFTINVERLKQNNSQKNRIDAYKVEPYDILISVKGFTGKVALIGEVKEIIVPAQTLLIIRLNETSNKRQKAIALYMFFKSNTGQSILKSITAGNNVPQIPTSGIKDLKVPNFTNEQLNELEQDFMNEQEIYKKISILKNEIEILHSKI